MLKVVLVDDEDIIREGLAAGVPWESLGFSIAGQAEDGEQAIQVIEAANPDLLITDVKMPFIDGLQLIERVKPKYPQMYIVIISGHDEFHYAQKALKLGAYDYILKPIDLDYLQVLLRNILASDETRKRKELEVLSLQQKVASSLPLFQEKFLRDLLTENIDPAEIDLKTAELQIDPAYFWGRVCLIQLDDYYIIAKDLSDQQRKELERAFNELIKRTHASEETFVLALEAAHKRVLVILGREEACCADEAIESILKETHYKMKAETGCTFTVGVGNICRSVQNLANSYREASEALNYQFILGKNRNIYFKDLNLQPQREAKSFDYDVTAVVSAIVTGDKNLMAEKLKNLVDILALQGGSQGLLQAIVGGTFTQALKILKEAGGSGEEVFNDPLEEYNRIIACQTAADMANRLTEVLARISDYIHIRKSNKFYQTIEKAKEFLRSNYAKEDLTLDEVARYVNMGPCYLSFTFKQEVGTNFTDYLNQIRLEKAKELLMVSNYKSYEVCYMVGYNNPTYFSTVFKKYVGVSPTEFKNKFKDQDTNKGN
ncbi:MAG: response regulator [Bacillota bacterium]